MSVRGAEHGQRRSTLLPPALHRRSHRHRCRGSRISISSSRLHIELAGQCHEPGPPHAGTCTSRPCSAAAAAAASRAASSSAPRTSSCRRSRSASARALPPASAPAAPSRQIAAWPRRASRSCAAGHGVGLGVAQAAQSPCRPAARGTRAGTPLDLHRRQPQSSTRSWPPPAPARSWRAAAHPRARVLRQAAPPTRTGGGRGRRKGDRALPAFIPHPR